MKQKKIEIKSGIKVGDLVEGRTFSLSYKKCIQKIIL